MDDRANHGDQPSGGDIASKGAFCLASFEERNELRDAALGQCSSFPSDR